MAHGNGTGERQLHHWNSISTLSDDGTYDPHGFLRARESMISLDSEYAHHAPPRSFSRGGRSAYVPVMQTMPEHADEVPLTHVAAAPVPSSYEAIRGEEVPQFDFTVSLGLMDAQDQEFIRKLQEQEASGRLTGGLGQGFRAETRVRGAELLSSSPVQRSLSKSFARRRSRVERIRSMGQDEANRRGEVIEVIMEEPSADLSHLEGPDIVAGERKSARTSQVFYPQPNWKPFSMQWPYLTVLVVASLGLAVMQEVLLRTHRTQPLVEFRSPNEIDPAHYFAVKFAPTLVAVVYGVLWQFTDFDVRRLEAFYQLSKKGGASAADSINLDYTTSVNFFRPLRALSRGHYAVVFSSVASILAVSLLPTFAAASVVLSPDRAARVAHPDRVKTLDISPLFSRLLTATLVVIALLASGLFYLLQSRRSGLLADVRGIAGLASMAVVSHILMDFKDMDTAKHDDIHHRLKYNRYVLRNSSLAPDDDNNAVAPKDRGPVEGHHLPAHPHPIMLRKAGLVSMIVGLVLFTAFIPLFLFSPVIVVTDRAPGVVTLMAVGLRMAWGGMETSVRVMEPYYILSKRHAPPKTLLLDYTALPFGWMPIRALLNGHVLVCLVGLGSIMAEFLTILVTGLATVDGHDFVTEYKSPGDPQVLKAGHQINAGQETVRSFYVSVVLSLFILVYMSSVGAWVLLRRRHAFLPRQPNTIASVLAYIHQSKMLYDFVGTGRLSGAEVLRRLEEADDGRGVGRTYGLGWFAGRDGQRHCGVDREELAGGYKHGIDFLQGIQPWSTRWDVL